MTNNKKRSTRRTTGEATTRDSTNWKLFAIPAAFFFLLALISIPIKSTLEDSGEFILSAYKLGIPHPPGYPLYVWIGHLFTYLPFGSIAWRVHLLSAVCGAATCGFVALSARKVGATVATAIVAGLVFAASKTFWNLGIIAEVYVPNAMFFFALLWIALDIHERFDKRKFLIFSFLYGLSLSNHWPLIGLASGVFAVLFAPHWREVLRALPSALPLGLLGLTPYLLLFIGSEVAFLGPMKSFGDIWHYFLRSEYAADDVQATATSADSAKFFLDFLRRLSTEFGYFGIPFLVAGLWSLLRTRMWIAIALLSAFLSSPLLLFFALKFEFNMLTSDVFSVFHLVPYGIGAIWIATGIGWILNEVVKNEAMKKPVLMALSVLFIGQAVFLNSRHNLLRSDSFGFEFAKLSLESLPANSVYIGWADPDVGSFLYAHAVENIRPDIFYTTQTGVLFNRLYDRRETRIDTQRAVIVTERIHQWLDEGRRVFTFRRLFYSTGKPEKTPLRYVQHGLYYEIVKDLPSAIPKAPMDVAQKSIEILDRVEAGHYGTQWTYYRNMMMARLCRVLILNGVDHGSFTSNRECKIVLAETLRDRGDQQGSLRVLEQVMDESDDLPLLDQIESAKYYLITRIAIINTSPSSAGDRIAAFQAAVDRVTPLALRVPGCNNSLALAILEARSQISLKVDLAKFGSMFGRCESHRKFLKEIGRKK